MALRLFTGVGALICAFGLYLQYVLTYDGMAAQGATSLEATWRYFAYFTILTNCLVALVLARAAFSPRRLAGLNAPRVELMTVTSIIFVGIVYNVLLASRWNPQGWQKLADVIVHDVMPVWFVLFWLMRPHGALKWKDAAFAAIWPAAYAIYGLARGAFDHFYPYFFMDPTKLSIPQLAINMTALIASFVVGAFVLIAASRLLGRRKAPSQT